jgi:hypothetical protein
MIKPAANPSVRFAAKAEAGPAVKVQKEDPPLDGLEEGVPPTYLGVSDNNVRSGISSDERIGLFESMPSQAFWRLVR